MCEKNSKWEKILKLDYSIFTYYLYIYVYCIIINLEIHNTAIKWLDGAVVPEYGLGRVVSRAAGPGQALGGQQRGAPQQIYKNINIELLLIPTILYCRNFIKFSLSL